MLITVAFIVYAQVMLTLSADQNEHFIQKRLHSLALLRGNRLYLAKDLQSNYDDKVKRSWLRDDYRPEDGMKSYNYYIPYFPDD